jgi:hypothetical protein
MAGGGGAASAEVISLAGIESASVAAARMETTFADTFGRTGSSALASLAADSNHGE